MHFDDETENIQRHPCVFVKLGDNSLDDVAMDKVLNGLPLSISAVQ